MTAEDYFGDWTKVIDDRELAKVMKWLNSVNLDTICPFYKNIFRAFRECPYKDCSVVMLGQDPYPQPGVATGILFGNKQEVPENLLSPSLKVIKTAIGATENFDNTMLSWVKQGVLMINSALTCNVNQIGSHVDLWRPFVMKLVSNICRNRPDIIFVLFGTQAQYFANYISNCVIREKHPAYYARIGFPMSREAFDLVNKQLALQGKPEIIYT